MYNRGSHFGDYYGNTRRFDKPKDSAYDSDPEALVEKTENLSLGGQKKTFKSKFHNSESDVLNRSEVGIANCGHWS